MRSGAKTEKLVSTAQKLLSPRKKRLSPSTCLEVTAQVIAVDLGVKPALLYDSSEATSEQLHLFLCFLEDSGITNTPLKLLSIDENLFIFNPGTVISHLQDLLHSRSLLMIDVCSSRKHPFLAGFDSMIEDMITVLLTFFMNLLDEGSSVTVMGKEIYKDWNLCTLFGVLLGYPASYWFDQTKGFESCLCMTPLVVNMVSVRWQIHNMNQRSCLYSFSVPERLWSDAESLLQQWSEHLRLRFNKQTVLTDLCISQKTITLTSVTL